MGWESSKYVKPKQRLLEENKDSIIGWFNEGLSDPEISERLGEKGTPVDRKAIKRFIEAQHTTIPVAPSNSAQSQFFQSQMSGYQNTSYPPSTQHTAMPATASTSNQSQQLTNDRELLEQNRESIFNMAGGGLMPVQISQQLMQMKGIVLSSKQIEDFLTTGSQFPPPSLNISYPNQAQPWAPHMDTSWMAPSTGIPSQTLPPQQTPGYPPVSQPSSAPYMAMPGAVLNSAEPQFPPPFLDISYPNQAQSWAPHMDPSWMAQSISIPPQTLSPQQIYEDPTSSTLGMTSTDTPSQTGALQTGMHGISRNRKRTLGTEIDPNPHTKNPRRSPSTSQIIESIKSELSKSNKEWEDFQNFILITISELDDTGTDRVQIIKKDLKEIFGFNITDEQLETYLNTELAWNSQEEFKKVKEEFKKAKEESKKQKSAAQNPSPPT